MRAPTVLLVVLLVALTPNATDVRSREIQEAQADPTSLFDMSTP